MGNGEWGIGLEGEAVTREELAKAVKEAAYLEGDFILSSGQRSKYYLDKWRFETDPALLREIQQARAKAAQP